MRFRQELIAITADIETMFYQVKVPSSQRRFMRFLWWDGGDTTKEIKEFEMNAHVFGVASSPGCANYAFQRTAVDNSAYFSEKAVETVLDNFYVDDLLKSASDVASARTLVRK